MADQTTQSASPVWSTAELLENILSHVPPSTAFLLRGTNTFFKQLIDNSPTLSKLLYLRADNSIPQPFWMYARRGLRANFFSDTPRLDIIVGAENIQGHQIIGTPFTLNPILLRPPSDDQRWTRGPEICGSIAVNRSQVRRDVYIPTIIGNMFITQPPITNVGVYVSARGKKKDELRIQREEGVRFKDLMISVHQNGDFGRIQLFLQGPPVFVTWEGKRKVEGGP